MMKKGVWLIVVVCILFAGCIGSPPEINNPLSSAPGMIMDYDKNTDTTKIWVKGETTDYRYSNITITVSKDKKQIVSSDNNTYCLQCNINNINLPSFSLRIVVWTENTCYEYVCNDVTVHEVDPFLTVIEDEKYGGKENIVFEKDLPFKKTLSEVEE